MCLTIEFAMDYRSEHNNDGGCGRYLSVDDNIEHYSIRTNQHTQIQWETVRAWSRD